VVGAKEVVAVGGEEVSRAQVQGEGEMLASVDIGVKGIIFAVEDSLYGPAGRFE